MVFRLRISPFCRLSEVEGYVFQRPTPIHTENAHTSPWLHRLQLTSNAKPMKADERCNRQQKLHLFMMNLRYVSWIIPFCKDMVRSHKEEGRGSKFYWMIHSCCISSMNIHHIRFTLHTWLIITSSNLISTLAVASSTKRILFFLSNALPRHNSCLCPTLKFVPPSETFISNFSG